MTRPFEGVKVLDFTQVLAGPYASYQLALLGADVIKVERREGEDMRRTPLSREWADRGLAPAFQAINGNKRSLTLDLSKPEAIAIVKQLAGQVDVVMENFRPGVMDKLGIGYAALSAINPRLIYCAISGFGQTGPGRTGAGYDGKMQALSGIMSITGHPETGPTRAGFAVCDVLSGSTAAFGVSSALFQRTHTGKGQLVDVSMLEATLAFLSGQIADYSVAGHRQQLSGNQAVSRRPTANLFKAGDGFLLLAVNSEKQYIALMTALGCADALQDPRFVDWFARRENEPALRAIIEEALASKGAREWEKVLEEAGAPCASIWKVEEVIDHPQIAARGAIQDTRYARWTVRFRRQRVPTRPWRRPAHGSWRRRSAPTPRRCWPRSAMTPRPSQDCGRARWSNGSGAGRLLLSRFGAAGCMATLRQPAFIGAGKRLKDVTNPHVIPRKRHARLPLPHHDPRPQHGGRPRLLAGHRHEERGLRQADHCRGQFVHPVRARPRPPARISANWSRARSRRRAASPRSSTRSRSMTASPWAMTACCTACRRARSSPTASSTWSMRTAPMPWSASRTATRSRPAC